MKGFSVQAPHTVRDRTQKQASGSAPSQPCQAASPGPGTPDGSDHRSLPWCLCHELETSSTFVLCLEKEENLLRLFLTPGFEHQKYKCP